MIYQKDKKTSISVALAIYNGERYLPELLENLLLQTRLPDELVVSDDASTDSTVAILRDFAQKAPFAVRIHTHSKNRGVTKNFENAVSKCTGNFIFLSDHDDVWLPDKIYRTAELLIKNPRAGVAFCNAQMGDETLAPLGYTLWEALGFSRQKQEKVRTGNALEIFLQYSMIAGMTMAFRSTLLDMLLPFPDMVSCHDTWILLLAAAVSDISFTPDTLAIHRVHGKNNSNMTKKNLYQQYLKARAQIKNDRLTYSLKFNQALQERLNRVKNNWNVKPSALDLLQKKIAHAQLRVDMPGPRMKRVFPIANEMKNRNYARFSYGIKSALQDLLLR
ncbi:MAG: glycosyltransferase [Desulfobacteraceae bacterium]|jgi:glycosyltransferase involved in cell wall biosynthesis|nr:glycosyltransferase [Desulfobacteraceae bacterium]